MAFRVVLDANVVLAACLDPGMDAKADVAADVLKVLAAEALRPAVTESISAEIERMVSTRVGQILHALRDLSNGPPPTPTNPNQTAWEVFEQLFANLRQKTPGAAGALQLLESRLAVVVNDAPIIGDAQWKILLDQVAIETTAMLAEIQRKQGALGLDVLPRAGKVDHERFRGIVPGSDLEHIAVLAAISEARNMDFAFVTMDGGLHAVRDAITRAAPRVTVTTPPHLHRQIARLRGKH